MHKILLTASQSLLGKEILAQSSDLRHTIRALLPPDLEISDPASVSAAVANGDRGRPWDIVVNTANYPLTGRGKGDHTFAWIINALAPAALGESCELAGIPLVHVTMQNARAITDQVDGAVSLVTSLDASQSSGEAAVRTSGAVHTIIRPGTILTSQDDSIVARLLNLGAVDNQIQVFDSELNSIIDISSIPRRLMTVAENIIEGDDSFQGTFSMGDPNPVGAVEFATEVFSQSKVLGGPYAMVQGISPDARRDKRLPDVHMMRRMNKVSNRFAVSDVKWRDEVCAAVARYLIKK